MNKKILLAPSVFGEHDDAPLKRLRESGWDIVQNSFGRVMKEDELIHMGAECSGIVAGTEHYTARVFQQLPRLRVLSRCGTGMDGIDPVAAAARGIILVNTPYGPTRAVAELTLAFLLSLLRYVPFAQGEMARGVWKKRTGFLLTECVVGIVGLGRIGRCLAEMVRALGAMTIGCDKLPDREWANKAGVALCDLTDVLRRSDAVCLHLPFAPELFHAVGAKELALMKPGSFLINTSRGGLIDEEALAQALRNGHLAGAALDVFEKEPYHGPLAQCPNIILTPHVGSYARAARVAMEREAVENLLRGLADAERR